MSKFIQITDTHIVPEGELAYARSDTAAALKRAVETINAKLPVLGDVACAIVTGDLTDYGTPGEYDLFKAMMAELDLPYLAIPGNHDVREPMRAAFAGEGWMPQSGPVQWRHDLPAFTIVGLDTLVDGKHHGEIAPGGLAFLDAVLSDLAGKPVVVATHHHVFHTGIRPMDRTFLRNGADLLARLEAYRGPARIISGHVHRAMSTQIGSVTCQISPATCHAVNLDQREEAVNSLIMEPGGVTLFEWRDAPLPCLVSDVIPVGTHDGPWPFF